MRVSTGAHNQLAIEHVGRTGLSEDHKTFISIIYFLCYFVTRRIFELSCAHYPANMMVSSLGVLAVFASISVVTNAGLIRRAGVVPSLSGDPVDMTSGQGGTYPRASFLSDGSLIGAYAATAGDEKQLALVSSTDNGASWEHLGTAATRSANSSDLDNPYPLQLPDGRVLLAYRNHDKDPSTGNYTAFRIDISYSDDNGVSWEYLSTAATMRGGPIGIWEPFLRNAQDGSLQMYYSKENEADDQDSIERVSTNGGADWGDEMTISGADLTSRDGMTGVATISGSNLIAVFESEQGGYFQVDSITSPDDGNTWGNRQTVYLPTGTNNNAGAPQVVNVGGTLCVSFMTDEDTQLHDWVNGAGAKMITSGDGGSTWDNKIEVFEPQANWPEMVTLDDSSLLCMADMDGAKSQKVILS